MKPKHTKQELINSIKAMEEIVNDPENAESIKVDIRPSIKEAKKLLSELKEAESKSSVPAKKPSATEIGKIIKADDTKVKNALEKKTKAKHAKPMTYKQQQTLRDLVAKTEKYKGYRGMSESDLERDASRSADRPGKRTSASGHTYYESRSNRSDVNKGKPHLAEGGTIGEGKNGYIAFYKGKQVEVMADSSYAAQKKAAEHFKAKKPYDVSIILAETEGKQVTHIPDFASGGTITNQYIGKSAGEVWDTWTERQRIHFVDDHGLNPRGFIKSNYSEIEETINMDTFIQTLKNHVEQGEYASGGAIPGNQMTVYGYTTENFTAAAKESFTKAIEELDAEQDKESAYYNNATGAMRMLAQIVNDLLKRQQDATHVHEMLQSIGIYNYKTGLLLNTKFLNEELAERHLKGGGHLATVDSGTVYKKHVPGSKAEGGTIEMGSVGSEIARENLQSIYDTHKDTGKRMMIGDKKDYAQGKYDLLEGMNLIIVYKYPSGYSAEITGKGAALIESQMARGGRTTRGISRDRKFISQQPHEQRYDRRTPGKHYMAKGGTVSNKKTEQLAREFSNLLRKELTAEEMRKVIADNEASKDPATCASHDYIDANIVMAEAFKKVVGRKVTMPSDVEKNTKLGDREDEDLALWESAWDMAKKNKFYTKANLKKGGTVTFAEKQNAIAKNLKGKQVPDKYQEEYGKKYSKKDAIKAAAKIAGKMKKMEK